MSHNKNRLIYVLLFILITSMVITSCSGNSITVPDEYNYDDLSEYIKICDYKSFEYNKDGFEVSEADIKKEIDLRLSDTSQTVKKDSGQVTEDCIANIDYVGSIDGVEFDGGKGEGYDLDIANSTFIDGFAEALVGHSVGETFDIDVTFPENYGSPDLAGKPAVFNITVNYITEKVPAELNQEWVENNTAYSNVEDFKDGIENSLIESKLFELILDQSEIIKYPEKELESNKEKYSAYYQAEIDDENVVQAAQIATKQELVLHYISKLENIEITDALYNEYIDKLLSDSDLDRKTFEEKSGTPLAQYVADNGVFNSFIYQEVMDCIVKYVTK